MLEHLTVPISWKAAGNTDSGVLEGYASTFGNVDLGGDIIVKGAFTKTIANIKANGIPLLADHVASTSSVLGTIFDASEDDAGLKIKARFSSAPSAQDVRTKLLEGHLNRMSIGYDPVEYGFVDDADGRRNRKLIEIKLWETSVVVFPMNPEAAVTRVKSLIGSLDEPMRAAVSAALSSKDTTLPPVATGGSPADEAEVKATDEGATSSTNTAPADEAGSAPDEGAAGWDRWKSEALLAGRDPDATTDSATRAGLQTTLELMEASMGRKEG